MTNENENVNAKAKEPRSLREILDDVEHAEALTQHTDKQYEQYVQEYLQKIRILKTMVCDPSRFDQIEACFKKAVALEKRRNLKKIAMREYVSYLDDQNDYKHAIPVAELYLKYVELDDDKSQIADATNMLGQLYAATGATKQAQQKFIQANGIYEQLVAENPSVSYQAKLARNDYDLCTLYADYGDSQHMDLAEQGFLRAKKIYERLVAEDQLTYLIDLAKTCSCLGTLYSCMNRPELANEEFCRSRDLFEQDSKIHKFR